MIPLAVGQADLSGFKNCLFCKFHRPLEKSTSYDSSLSLALIILPVASHFYDVGS